MFLDLTNSYTNDAFQGTVTLESVRYHRKFQWINHVFIEYNIKKIKITAKFAGKIEEK
jgi:hypothetical protein